MNWRNYSAITTGIIIIMVALFIWFHVEQGRTDKNRKAEQTKIQDSEKKMREQLKASQGYISTLEGDLSEMRVRYAKSQDSLRGKIKGSTVKFIPIEKIDRLDTCLNQIELRQRAIDDQSALISSMTEEKTLAEAKNNEIKEELQGQIDLLDSANTAKLTHIDSLYENWPKDPSPWGIGLSAGPGTILSNGEVRTGLGLQAGIVYKIPLKPIRLRHLFRRKR
jgi:hypothetical protein